MLIVRWRIRGGGGVSGVRKENAADVLRIKEALPGVVGCLIRKALYVVF